MESRILKIHILFSYWNGLADYNLIWCLEQSFVNHLAHFAKIIGDFLKITCTILHHMAPGLQW